MSTEVKAQNTISMTSVKAIADATEQSKQLLATMEQYAEDAGTTLTGIYQDAEDAKTNASSAKASADTAMANLSQVQNVLEVVNWVALHGEYAKTSDVAINPTKTYYTVVGTIVSTPVNDDIGTYYELISGDYVKTTDPSVVISKTYYTVVGTPVASPDVADIGTYYELAINEAMANYIQAHLALTNDGLYVMADNSEWKVLVASDGVYILDPDDTIVAKYKNAITIGVDDNTQSYQYLDYHSMQMVDKEGDTYFYASDLRDTHGEATMVDTFTGDGVKVAFRLTFTNTSIVSATIDGVATSAYTRDYRTITFSTPPADGSVIVVTYISTDTTLKAYTLGKRLAGTDMGGMSFAEGYETEASGHFTHAEGGHTEASNRGAHAEGWYTDATGEFAHAEGMFTKAIGQGSHAEGADTEARSPRSHAQGHGTIAIETNQTVLGRYNALSSNKAVVIGNGTSDNARSNALAVDWNGNVETSGSLISGVDYSDAFQGDGYAVYDLSLAGSTYLGQAIDLGAIGNKKPIFNGFDIKGTGTARIHTLGHYIYQSGGHWYAYIKMRNDNTSAINGFTVTAYIAWI